jgi:hypothetical protein
VFPFLRGDPDSSNMLPLNIFLLFRRSAGYRASSQPLSPSAVNLRFRIFGLVNS